MMPMLEGPQTPEMAREPDTLRENSIEPKKVMLPPPCTI